MLMIATAGGMTLIYLLQNHQSWFNDRVRRSPGMALAIVAVACSVPLLAMSVYLWRFGHQVTEVRRFPLPGSAVLRDTPVVTDLAAERRGRMFQALAVLLAAAAIAMAVVFIRLASTFDVPGGATGS